MAFTQIWPNVMQNISKSLWKDAKLKCCEEIGDWHQSITNMVWWAIETSRGCTTVPQCHSTTVPHIPCAGNAALAREKILSILGHVTGR